VIHRDDEREDYHGIPLRAEYLMTETWIKERGQKWRLGADTTLMSLQRPTGNHDERESCFGEYEGHYRAAPGSRLYHFDATVIICWATREGGSSVALGAGDGRRILHPPASRATANYSGATAATGSLISWTGARVKI